LSIQFPANFSILDWQLPRCKFDLKHASRFNQIEAAARALGRHIEVRVA
jgi:antitoxin HicB